MSGFTFALLVRSELMRFLLVCNRCGAKAWAHGTEEQETNSCEVDEAEEWQGEDHSCLHDDFEVTHSEYDDPLFDDVL